MSKTSPPSNNLILPKKDILPLDLGEEDTKFLFKLLEEFAHGDRTFFDTLTENQKNGLIHIFRELADSGQSNLLDLIWELDYEEKPISVEKFLSDPYYIGKSFAKTLYDKWKETICTVINNKKTELILTGSIGSGKTSCAVALNMYKLYELLCMRNPVDYYNATNLVFGFFSVNLDLAHKVGHQALTTRMLDSEYFRDRTGVDLEEFSRKSIKDILVLPKGIKFIFGSRSGHVLGTDVIGAFMDEVAFSSSVDSKQIIDLYSGVKFRLETRFMDEFGHLPGTLCVTGDTRIKLLNGNNPTIKELADNNHKNSFWVYSYDTKNKVMVPGKAHSPRLTRIKTNIVKVLLDNGKSIRCTEDHPFLTKSGNYVCAGDLVEGERLEPLYWQELKDGYENILGPYPKGRIPTHRLVARNIYGTWPTHGYVVHHKNFNKKDNNPDNLILMEAREHQRYHRTISKPSKETIIKFIEGKNKFWASERGKELRIELGKVGGKKNWIKNFGGHINDLKNGVVKPVFYRVCCINCKKEFNGLQGFSKHHVKACSYIYDNIKNLKNLAIKCKSKHQFLKESGLSRDQVELFLLNFGEFLGLSCGKGSKRKCTVRLFSMEEVCEIALNCGSTSKASVSVALGYNKNGVALDRILRDNNTSWRNFKRDILKSTKCINHKVVSVKPDGVADVYDLTVENTHNFLVDLGDDSGVFLHNCIASSANYEGDFLDTHINECVNDPRVHIASYAIYDVKKYVGERFRVQVGDQSHQSKILDTVVNGKVTPMIDPEEGVRVVEVPALFYKDYELNLEKALRDLSGVSLFTSNPLITDRSKILGCVDNSREHPFTLQEIPININNDELTIESVFKKDLLLILTDPFRNKYIPRYDPSSPRFIHVDLGIKNDSAGIAMCHMSGVKEVIRRGDSLDVHKTYAPVINFDFMLKCPPTKGSEIDIEKIDSFIFYLVSLGMPIELVTFDGYQSTHSIQNFNKKGIPSQVLSVDRKIDPYMALKTAIMESRCSFYNYPPFLSEIAVVQRVDIKQKASGRYTTKIDHPVHGEKDLGDAAAGSIFSVITSKYAEEQLNDPSLLLGLKEAITQPGLSNDPKQSINWVANDYDSFEHLTGIINE
jgi:hypothetical protein